MKQNIPYKTVISEMTYYVSSGTLNATHSLTHSLQDSVRDRTGRTETTCTSSVTSHVCCRSTMNILASSSSGPRAIRSSSGTWLSLRVCVSIRTCHPPVSDNKSFTCHTQLERLTPTTITNVVACEEHLDVFSGVCLFVCGFVSLSTR